MANIVCNKCGSTEYTTSQSGIHIKASCSLCGSYIKFLPQSDGPMDKMPLGKYKGWYFDEIDDKYYLEWLLYSSGLIRNKRLFAAIEKRMNE
jgi:hypothetical protein